MGLVQYHLCVPWILHRINKIEFPGLSRIKCKWPFQQAGFSVNPGITAFSEACMFGDSSPSNKTRVMVVLVFMITICVLKLSGFIHYRGVKNDARLPADICSNS